MIEFALREVAQPPQPLAVCVYLASDASENAAEALAMGNVVIVRADSENDIRTCGPDAGHDLFEQDVHTPLGPSPVDNEIFRPLGGCHALEEREVQTIPADIVEIG